MPDDDLSERLAASRYGRVLRAVKERATSPSHRAFVEAAYRAILWRTPDAEGRDHYVGGLRRGELSRFRVLRFLAESPEAAKHVLFGPGFRQYVDGFAGGGRAAGVAPVLFLHAMKSGGTALAAGLSELCEPWPAIRDVWVDHLVCFPQPMLAGARLVTGHLPYAVLDVLPADTVACTVVREPVGRTLSHLAHLRTHGQQADLTLEQFVTDERWHPAWVDYQARQLAVDVPVGEAMRGERPLGLQAMLDQPAPIDDDELRRRALERLEAIPIVGVTDDLDAVLLKVADLWGKPAPAPLKRENASLAPVKRADVPAELLTRIEAGTTIDAELYARAWARQ